MNRYTDKFLKKYKRLVLMLLFISAGGFLLFFGTPNFYTIQQNRLNRDLLRAVWHHDAARASALLNQGADVDTKDDNPIADTLFRITEGVDAESGCTILMFSCADENMPLVQLLLRHGADVNRKNNKGRTALMWAVMVQNAQMVALLLDKRASVNVAADQGDTALMQAARRGDLIIVKQLLKHGADIKARDKQNRTALTWTIHNQRPQVIALLKQAGAK